MRDGIASVNVGMKRMFCNKTFQTVTFKVVVAFFLRQIVKESQHTTVPLEGKRIMKQKHVFIEFGSESKAVVL